MGGPGSGNTWGRSGWGRSTVEGYRRIDVRHLNRRGLLTAVGWRGLWTWSVDGERTASVMLEATRAAVTLDYKAAGEAQRYAVAVEWTPCHYGGERPWWRCPVRGCGRRCAVIYGGAIFACRRCHQLAYSSQAEDRSSRLMRKADKIRERCGVQRPDSLEVKPRGMHWRTFNRLADQVERADYDSLASLVGRLDRLTTST